MRQWGPPTLSLRQGGGLKRTEEFLSAPAPASGLGRATGWRGQEGSGLFLVWFGLGLVLGRFRVGFELVLGFWVHLDGFEWIGFGWVGLFGGFGFENTPIPGAVFRFDLVGFGIILGRNWVYLG